jgi:predicted AAA+ superfamily ATPase/multimeric flavodoxin WrbA
VKVLFFAGTTPTLVIPRRDLAKVLALFRTFPVVAILGARQVGKTTFARQLAEAAGGAVHSFDLEHAPDLARLREPILALGSLHGLVVLDGIQLRPDLFPVLRVLADRPEAPARFLVLGSASPALLRQGSETLAGRIAFVELHGFDLDEAGPARWERLWLRGGFPRSFLARDEKSSRLWRAEFVRSYLERVLPDLGVEIPPPTVRRYWAMLAHYHGQHWNGAELARAFGVSEKTVRAYLGLLVATFLARRLPPYHANLAQREVKAPKVYLADTGILHTLLGVRDREDLLGHPKVGASFEGFALQQVIARLGAREEECFHWGLHTGGEIALLVVRGRRRLGFEFKCTDSPEPTRSMRSAREALGLDGIDVVHAGESTYPMGSGPRAVAIREVGRGHRPLVLTPRSPARRRRRVDPAPAAGVGSRARRGQRGPAGRRGAPMAQRRARKKRIRIVEGQESVALTKRRFLERFRARFYDPAFAAAGAEIDALAAVAWEAYDEYRKSPRTARAGRDFADPEYELPIEWLETRRKIREADRRRRNRRSKSRILVINGSARSDQSCPGEVSKTWRLAQHAREAVGSQRGFECDFLDLSRLASEYGRVIYPCKACVSTAQPLCHWPCSCYPNHAMGQVSDWMNEIYPMWAGAHGVMILAPVNWYQAPSVLKSMIDRLVCADGGNPDPTTTDGKDPEKAKALELRGWDYPKHLSGRAFAVFVHGDAAGAENLRRILTDWLTDLDLVPAGPHAGVDRYIGYYRDYATSHDDLDAEPAVWGEVRNLALGLCETVRQIRTGAYRRPDERLEEPRKK